MRIVNIPIGIFDSWRVGSSATGLLSLDHITAGHVYPTVAFAKKYFHDRLRYQLVNHQIPHCPSSFRPYARPGSPCCLVPGVTRSATSPTQYKTVPRSQRGFVRRLRGRWEAVMPSTWDSARGAKVVLCRLRQRLICTVSRACPVFW